MHTNGAFRLVQCTLTGRCVSLPIRRRSFRNPSTGNRSHRKNPGWVFRENVNLFICVANISESFFVGNSYWERVFDFSQFVQKGLHQGVTKTPASVACSRHWTPHMTLVGHCVYVDSRNRGVILRTILGRATSVRHSWVGIRERFSELLWKFPKMLKVDSYLSMYSYAQLIGWNSAILCSVSHFSGNKYLLVITSVSWLVSPFQNRSMIC